MPELLFIFPAGKPTETLYEDGVDFNLFGDAEIVRNSHVEPIAGSTDWMIVWQGEFIEMFGAETSVDENGKSFKSHRAAVDCEKRMLLKHHYKVRAMSKTLTVDNITKEQFDRFRKVQYDGKYNMLTESIPAARAASLDDDTFAFIRDNYEALAEKHGEYKE